MRSAPFPPTIRSLPLPAMMVSAPCVPKMQSSPGVPYPVAPKPSKTMMFLPSQYGFQAAHQTSGGKSGVGNNSLIWNRRGNGRLPQAQGGGGGEGGKISKLKRKEKRHCLFASYLEDTFALALGILGDSMLQSPRNRNRILRSRMYTSNRCCTVRSFQSKCPWEAEAKAGVEVKAEVEVEVKAEVEVEVRAEGSSHRATRSHCNRLPARRNPKCTSNRTSSYRTCPHTIPMAH